MSDSMKIALCRAYNEPETKGALMSCTSAVKTVTGVWVCSNDFHLDLADVCGPHDCRHKEIRTLT